VIGDSPSTGALIQTINADGSSWVNVERPTDAEMDVLTREFAVLRTDLEAALDRSGPTGVWRRQEHVVITLHLPTVGLSQSQTGRTSAPVTLFIGRNFLVTVHTGEVRQLNRLFRHFESDELARAEAFSAGIGGAVFSVIGRLVDTTGAARASVERAIAEQEDIASRAVDSQRSTRETVLGAARLRADARSIHRYASPLPGLIRSLVGLDPIADAAGEGWDRLIARAERLVLATEHDLAAVDGLILAATAIAQLESARSLRGLLVIAALTLPVIAVVTLMALPVANPLASVGNPFTLAVALAGVVFLVALFGLRRRGFV
jgi:magnesium transporter